MYDVRCLWPAFLLIAVAATARPAPAARTGARVHLVEALPKMGGVITWAWLTTWDMNLTPEGSHLTRGIFWEYYQALGLSFDLEEAINKLTWHVYRERLVGSTPNAPLSKVLIENGRIVGAEFDDRDWQRTLTVRARQVIDATDDADLATAAGVSFVLGRPGPGGVPWMQAAGLIFRVANVNWQELVADLLKRKGAGADPAAWGVNGRTAWGYQPMMKRYKPTQPETAVLGLNLALQRDGSVLINSLQLFGVNGVDPASVEQGLAKGRAELPPLVAFLRQEIPGFAQAQLAGHAPMLYVREARHVRGMYALTVEDIFAGRVFPARVAGACPHGGAHTLSAPPRPVPAPSEAAGSARVIPATMALGQAAGVAAAFCARRGCTPRELARSAALLVEVQRTLRAQGAHIGGDGTP